MLNRTIKTNAYSLSVQTAVLFFVFICAFGTDTGAQIRNGRAGVYPVKEASGIVKLNGRWKFKYISGDTLPGRYNDFARSDFNDAGWDSIPVPGNWEMYGFTKPVYKKPSAGFGLYRTKFVLPTDWKTKHVFIRFNGVLYGYTLSVNGRNAGTWASAYNPCQFDISKFIKNGTNTLAVKVTTRDKGYEFDTNDAWGLSGIYRDVYLYAVPEIHFKDVTLKTQIRSKTDAEIHADIKIAGFEINEISGTFSLAGSLFGPQGNEIYRFTLPLKLNRARDYCTDIVRLINVKNPLLWNAETPYLYGLNLVILNGRDTVQRDEEQIGIRQISIDNGVFRINGVPVKLRGVNRHEIYPTDGRALTEEQRLQDINLMKAGNIDFVRTSHYPPDERFIQLCDEKGIYVMCEVPFGYGDNHLRDTSYQNILLTRAAATVARDKNHPSVIIWSIGNENPYTPLVENTAKYVKKLDPSRPICIPQSRKDFDEEGFKLPKFIDVLSPHYPTPELLEKYAEETKRPIIVSEYSHALGLAMEDQGTLWRIMRKYPKLAGGNIWLWADQGILKKSDKKNFPGKGNTDAVWIDSTHFYDCAGNMGTDGIVYSDRTPQVDYFEVRKNYSPIKIKENKIRVKKGRQNINITLENQYDFINLRGSYVNWKLSEGDSAIGSGALMPECPARDSVKIKLNIFIPRNPRTELYLLSFSVFDKDSHPVYEHSVRLLPPTGDFDPAYGLSISADSRTFKTADGGDSLSVVLTGTKFKLNKKTGMISLTEGRTGEKFIIDGPYARTGRKPSMAERRIKDKYFKDKDFYWFPYLLKDPELISEKEDKSSGKYTVTVKYKYERADKKNEYIEGTVNYEFSRDGSANINFDFIPQNASSVFLEDGISFLLPKNLTEFRWLGEGPYSSYPGKYELNDYGIYHINFSDINYEGNRADVSLAAVTDKEGNGIGLLCGGVNINIERAEGGIVFSFNSGVSGRGTKVRKSEYPVYAKNVKHIKGEFKLIPLSGKQWPKTFKDIFGEPGETVKPFNPFLTSYDQ